MKKMSPMTYTYGENNIMTIIIFVNVIYLILNIGYIIYL